MLNSDTAWKRNVYGNTRLTIHISLLIYNKGLWNNPFGM